MLSNNIISENLRTGLLEDAFLSSRACDLSNTELQNTMGKESGSNGTRHILL
jgi:hypothetical protein